MALIVFSILTALATWILLLIGGIVNPMGASLACPDWYFVPTCNGELLPEMVGGVLFEHGHRLWASLVGLMTLVLSIWMHLKKGVPTRLKRLSLVAVFLVALQGTLGGITVRLGLSAPISTLHLACAMVFFCLLIYLAFSLAQGPKGSHKAGTPLVLKLALAAVFVQISLGGWVRHVGAGMACGDDWLSCGPQFWPEWILGQIHMSHRLFGYLVFVLIGCSSVQAYRMASRSGFLAKSFAFVPFLLVVVQIGLGLYTVASLRSVPVVVLHTAIGALVLGAQWLLILAQKRRGHA